MAAATTYFFRVRAENSAGVSNYATTASATTLASSPPPATLEETGWYNHTRTLTRKNVGSHGAAIYFDALMTPQSATWMNTPMDDFWDYTKTQYGNFSDPNLYCVFHLDDGDYAGGAVQKWTDEESGYRNVVDVGSPNWTSMTAVQPPYWNLDAMTHEMGHIVEGASKGVRGSVAWGIWGDGRWPLIFQYDLYSGKLPAQATRFFNQWVNAPLGNAEYYPTPNAFWLRDWWSPLHSGSQGNATKGTAMLNKFFDLTSQNYAQRGSRYLHEMNMGEFVHFWSATAGIDLRARAKIAFGWSTEWELQFRQAKAAYPALNSLYTTTAGLLN
ncbi:MAG: hypothetical protein QM756_09800 [Polyangiaceae bacterium]